MKTPAILFTVFLSLFFTNTKAQDKKYPEPDFPDKIYYFDQTANKTVELEYGYLNETERAKGFAGMGGEEKNWEYNKPKSMVRVKKGDKIGFLIKYTSEENSDPPQVYSLVQFTTNPKTNKREIITAKTDAWTTNTNSKLKKIFFSSKKVVDKRDQYDNISYIIRLITVSNLEPGEYAFVQGESECSFFGVD